jgi:hypothetical protein
MNNIDESDIIKIANATYEKIAKTFTDFMENISQGQTTISKNVELIKEEQIKMNERIVAEERRMLNIEEKIERGRDWIERVETKENELEERLNAIGPEKIKAATEDIHALKKTFSGVRIAIYITLITIILICLIALLHRNGYLQFLGGNQHSGLQQIEYNQKNGIIVPNVRSDKTHKMTVAERDTLENHILRLNIKPISGITK